MHIRSLYLKNFRNYEEKHFEFGPQINIIRGPNARGKTSILEAIHLLMTGRSFRSSQIKELIKHDQSEFYIELTFLKHGVEQRLRMAHTGKERKIFYNNTPCHAATSLIGVIPGTIMAPDDVSMVKGQPKLRRRFLDIQLALSDPLYVHHLTRYQRAMSCRNVLLKSKNLTVIDVWEQEMATAASYIVFKRYRALNDLQEHCSKILSKISMNTESIQLKYKSQCPDKEKDGKGYYFDLYKKMRSRELHFGKTLVGPQRDDMQILIGEKEARFFASEGQQRSCIAALRFAEWENLCRYADEKPLMLIDDLGISLDMSRRAHLFEHIGNLQQVFITTTENTDSFNTGTEPRVINL